MEFVLASYLEDFPSQIVSSPAEATQWNSERASYHHASEPSKCDCAFVDKELANPPKHLPDHSLQLSVFGIDCDDAFMSTNIEDVNNLQLESSQKITLGPVVVASSKDLLRHTMRSKWCMSTGGRQHVESKTQSVFRGSELVFEEANDTQSREIIAETRNTAALNGDASHSSFAHKFVMSIVEAINSCSSGKGTFECPVERKEIIHPDDSNEEQQNNQNNHDMYVCSALPMGRAISAQNPTARDTLVREQQDTIVPSRSLSAIRAKFRGRHNVDVPHSSQRQLQSPRRKVSTVAKIERVLSSELLPAVLAIKRRARASIANNFPLCRAVTAARNHASHSLRIGVDGPLNTASTLDGVAVSASPHRAVRTNSPFSSTDKHGLELSPLLPSLGSSVRGFGRSEVGNIFSMSSEDSLRVSRSRSQSGERSRSRRASNAHRRIGVNPRFVSFLSSAVPTGDASPVTVPEHFSVHMPLVEGINTHERAKRGSQCLEEETSTSAAGLGIGQSLRPLRIATCLSLPSVLDLLSSGLVDEPLRGLEDDSCRSPCSEHCGQYPHLLTLTSRTSSVAAPPLRRMGIKSSEVSVLSTAALPTPIVTTKATRKGKGDDDEDEDDDAFGDGYLVLNDYVLLCEVGRGRYGTVMVAYNLLSSPNEEEQEGTATAAAAAAPMKAIKIVPRVTMARNRLMRTARSPCTSRSISTQYVNASTADVCGTATTMTTTDKAPERPECAEVEAMRRLRRHPNILPLEEVIDDPCDANLYLVMPFIERGPVVKLDARGRCEPVASALLTLYMRQLLSAVAHMHRHGVAHCDIKPDNILLGDDGRLFLADFGACEIFDRGAGDGHAPPRPPFATRKIKGTLAFTAPEALSGAHYDASKADVWAVGVCLYAFLFGHLPFHPAEEDPASENEAKTAFEFFSAITSGGEIDLFKACWPSDVMGVTVADTTAIKNAEDALNHAHDLDRLTTELAVLRTSLSRSQGATIARGGGQHDGTSGEIRCLVPCLSSREGLEITRNSIGNIMVEQESSADLERWICEKVGAIKLMENLLLRDPSARPTARVALQHIEIST